MYKHTAAFDDQLFTRNSKGRKYTHAVIARPSGAESLRRATSPVNAERDAKDYAYYSVAEHHHNGLTYGPYNYGGAKILGRTYTSPEEFLATFPTVDTYLAANHQARLDDHYAKVERGEFDRWICLGWTGRRDLAEKRAQTESGKAYYAEVRVIPAVIG